MRRPIRPPLFGKRGRAGRVAGGDQITRPTVDRHREFGTGKARAGNDRLEVTGHQALALAQARDAHGLKILLEEGAGGIGILRLQSERLAADIRQGAGDLHEIVGARSFARGVAAGLVGGEGGEMIIGSPAGKLAPFDRLELAAGEFQRLFGRCGVGRETQDRARYDRAGEACDNATPRGLRKSVISHANKCIADRNGLSPRANADSRASARLCCGGVPDDPHGPIPPIAETVAWRAVELGLVL